MKKIEDYLHLYLGCQVMLFSESENPAIKPEIKRVIAEKSETPFEISLASAYFVRAKPILRPLRDMTDEENQELQKIEWPDKDDFCYRELGFIWKLKKHFDLFGLIEAGLALDKTDLKCDHKNSSYNFCFEQHYCPDCKKVI